MDHSSLCKENWFKGGRKEKRKPALLNKNIKLRKNFADTYKELTTEDSKELYGPRKQKLTVSSPTRGPGTELFFENNDQTNGIKQIMKFEGEPIRCWSLNSNRSFNVQRTLFKYFAK